MSRCTVALRTSAVLIVVGVQGVRGGETYMSIIPVGTGPNGELAAGAVIEGNAITLTTDGIDPVPVFLEIRIGDWDPADTGTTLAWYQPHFDLSSLTSGASGALTFNVGSTSCGECSDTGDPCYAMEDCTAGSCSGTGDECHQPREIEYSADCPSGESCLGAAYCDPIASVARECSDNGDPCFDARDCTPGACGGSGDLCHTTADDCISEHCVGAATCDAIASGNDICEAELAIGARCGPTAYSLGSGTCSFAYVDMSRPDFALADAVFVMLALDVSFPDIRPSAAALVGPPDDPEPFPAEGLYGATLALLVPPDAQGTFTISLKPTPWSGLGSGAGPPITPLTVIPAQIRVNPGRCCVNLQLTPDGRDRCTDGLTENECTDQNGVTFFEPGETCANPCPAVCGDNIINHFSEECDGMDNAACIGICLDDCTCNPTCGDVDGDGNADMLGMAIFMNCFTGPDGGPVTSECQCARYDSDDDVDLDDLAGFYHIMNGP